MANVSTPNIVQAGKMTYSEYNMLHVWVRKNLGAPSLCWNCGDTRPRRYEWANKSNEYKHDLSDWERLCKPCHRRKDTAYLKAHYPDKSKLKEQELIDSMDEFIADYIKNEKSYLDKRGR